MGLRTVASWIKASLIQDVYRVHGSNIDELFIPSVYCLRFLNNHVVYIPGGFLCTHVCFKENGRRSLGPLFLYFVQLESRRVLFCLFAHNIMRYDVDIYIYIYIRNAQRGSEEKTTRR